MIEMVENKGGNVDKNVVKRREKDARKKKGENQKSGQVTEKLRRRAE